MNATPAGIIENTKHLFLSEDFARAILVLRDCFDESDVSTDTIISLLKGKIGYSVSGNDVQFGKEFIDEDYTEEVGEILENYDFLIKIEDKVFQVESCFDFDLSHIAQTNDYIKSLLEIEDTLTKKVAIKYFREINTLMEEAGFNKFSEAEYVMYHNKRFFLIKEYNQTLIKEISKYYEPIDAVKAFSKTHDKYYG